MYQGWLLWTSNHSPIVLHMKHDASHSIRVGGGGCRGLETSELRREDYPLCAHERGRAETPSKSLVRKELQTPMLYGSSSRGEIFFPGRRWKLRKPGDKQKVTCLGAQGLERFSTIPPQQNKRGANDCWGD